MSAFLIAILALSPSAMAESNQTTITVWRGSLGPAWDKVENTIVAAFEDSHPGIKIDETTMPWSKFREKLFTAFRFGGELPDVIWEGFNLMQSYAATGGLAPLDSYVDSWDYRKETPSTLWQAATYQGHIYAVPFGGIPFVTLYNKKMFAEAGVTPPKSWADWITISKKLNEAGKGDYHAWAVRTDRLLQAFFVELLWQDGGSLFAGGIRNPGSQHKIEFNSDMGVEALNELVARASYAPGGLKGNVGLKGPDVVNLFAQGKIAMLSGSIHQYGQVLAINPSMKSDIGAFVDPPGPGPNGRNTSFLITNSLFLTKQSQHKQAAVEFMHFYVQNRWDVLRSTDLGYAPLRSDVTDKAVLDNQVVHTGMEAIQHAELQPDFPAWLEFRSTLMNAIQSVFLGQKTAKAALDGAASTLAASMSQ